MEVELLARLEPVGHQPAVVEGFRGLKRPARNSAEAGGHQWTLQYVNNTKVRIDRYDFLNSCTYFSLSNNSGLRRNGAIALTSDGNIFRVCCVHIKLLSTTRLEAHFCQK